MSYPVARYQIADADSRRPQACVWGDALEKFYQVGEGVLFEDDFVTVVHNTTDASSADGKWFIQDAAAGGTSESLIGKEGYGGLATLSAATGTAHFGIEMQRASAATVGAFVETPGSTTDAKGIVVFEARLTIDVSELQFVGLTECIANFLGATSALPDDSDYIGFYKTAGGNLTFVSRNDNAAGTAVEFNSTSLIDSGDLTDGGTYRLGFRVNQDGTVEVGVNDTHYVALDSTSGKRCDLTAIPEEALTARICLGRGGGADTTVGSDIDYVRVYNGPDSNG